MMIITQKNNHKKKIYNGIEINVLALFVVIQLVVLKNIKKQNLIMDIKHNREHLLMRKK